MTGTWQCTKVRGTQREALFSCWVWKLPEDLQIFKAGEIKSWTLCLELHLQGLPAQLQLHQRRRLPGSHLGVLSGSGLETAALSWKSLPEAQRSPSSGLKFHINLMPFCGFFESHCFPAASGDGLIMKTSLYEELPLWKTCLASSQPVLSFLLYWCLEAWTLAVLVCQLTQHDQTVVVLHVTV